uniref:DNA-(apurinic or apyrimidinic site) endonuclease 2 n=1 Tax=Musa acuminata subsp. malaccensis TaxID=214687 RepID=A0A804L529_MUSAM|nr:PREDICTED: DNA-(apurinic or apyrimidinic site) lyase 2 isoform X1 [Musa acuminata subsp. malaccensis]XP_018675749.1 PREDICTED: DNA-(apurinic or apyrimidinic site) lyase 2 isoform X1 [Musa acuminata subsp. malaccensis]XP_018675750.1 PREDICTED: DNA-(apurinic or apyrimidinic site) lyase 2 isoform X1 [Musa acuminata subsp. malaccensis]
MKIVTYNVNGLRQRVSQHGSLLRLLTSLDADIICFQETKLSRRDLSVDLTMAEGYEAFVSCTRTTNKGRSSYSGVATFCRVKSAFFSNEAALPLEAEEGFTGLLECPRKREIIRDFMLEAPFEEEDLEITDDDLLKVDSEGRCLITDHGHFVLFNIYGPRAENDDEERCRFKFIFFKILQRRWEFLLSQGKRVFVVGDLNIAPAAIDRCDASPDFEKNMFRKWLRSLFKECGGPFFDVFRSKNPGRKEAYTCFSPRVGAEEFNYGSRIDHILIAGPCLHQQHDTEDHYFLYCHVEACDIMSQFRRGNSGNAPKWRGGRKIKLEGSDHVPVYVILRDVPDLPTHSTPSIAVRYIPEVRGWQQSIVSFLVKGQVSHHRLQNNLSSDSNARETYDECEISSQDCSKIEQDIIANASQHSSDQCFSNLNSGQKPNPSLNEDSSLTFSQKKTESLKYLSSDCTRGVKKMTRNNTCSQLTLKYFFKQPKIVMTADEETLKHDLTFPKADPGEIREETSQSTEQSDLKNEYANHSCEISGTSIDIHDGKRVSEPCFPVKRENDNFAVQEWRRIQQKMKMTIPICKGHGEPCVSRSVKREGPNRGRLFYVCARAQGPASNPEANCGHFQWGSAKSKDKHK